MLKLINTQPPPRKSTEECPAPAVDDLAPLLQRCQLGERDAVRTLVVTVGPSMLQMVRRVLGSKDPEVEDVFQEATIGLVKALPAFRVECSTRHFACRIATLTALKARNRRRFHHEWSSTDDCDDGRAVQAVDEQDWALVAHRRDVLRRLLDEIPEAQAEAMVLHVVAGFTVEELAAATRAPVETARSRLRLAKAALRERIALDPSLSGLLEDSL
jgi:RNA polymerase sigma-70 factor (ECF subfamily)